MGPDVLHELGALGEALAAGAGERHLRAVQQLVRLQVGLHAVALVALRALEGPLARVQAPVTQQLPLQAEAPVAVGAREGPLAAVHAQVLAELAPVGEASAALGAGERPLPAVSQPVGSQQALQAEAQRALRALEGLLVRVQPLVPQQLSPLAEAPATVGAPERLLPAVDSAVLGESALFGEALVTLAAGEGPVPTAHALLDPRRAARAEAPVTLQAWEGLFSRVPLAVAGELGLGTEAHVVLCAREWPPPGGAALESLLAPPQVAVLSASGARAWLFSRAHTAKLGLHGDSPAAFPAKDGPPHAGLALLSLPAVLREKALVTYGVLGGPLPLVQAVVAEKGLLVMEAHVTFRALQWALP